MPLTLTLVVWTGWHQTKQDAGASAKEVALTRDNSFDSRPSFIGFSPTSIFFFFQFSQEESPHSFTSFFRELQKPRCFLLPALCNHQDPYAEAPVSLIGRILLFTISYQPQHGVSFPLSLCNPWFFWVSRLHSMILSASWIQVLLILGGLAPSPTSSRKPSR